MSFKGVAFLLEIITKSMVLKIHSTGEISTCIPVLQTCLATYLCCKDDEGTRSTRFSRSFLEVPSTE